MDGWMDDGWMMEPPLVALMEEHPKNTQKTTKHKNHTKTKNHTANAFEIG